jgi:hypothetical protein
MRASIRSRLSLTLLLCLGCSACTERKQHLSARRDEVLLAAAPKPQFPLDLSFDDKVDLIGYDLEPQRPAPAAPFVVTWYWRVRAPLGQGVQVFTHLADMSGVTQINLDAQRVVRVAYPEASWKAGDFIRDPQTVTLPASWSSPAAVLYVGFYVGSRRFDITRGKHDAERRGEALRVPITLGHSVANDAPLPELKVPHTRGKIVIDGRLDEADWRSAPETPPMVQTMTGAPGEFVAAARMLYDDSRLYVGFSVFDDYLKSTFDTNDDHLWEQDTVEVMFDPDGDGQNYFELQVSPRSVHFDTRYDSRRNPRPFGHVDWDSQVEARAFTQGKPNDDAADRGYSVELAVPFTAFATGTPPAAPPVAGTIWRINFFVMDARERGQRAVGWSPPRVGDFHTLERFGRVEFGP